VNGGFEDENICTEFHINCSPEGWISTSDAFDNFYKDPGIAYHGQHCITIEAGNSKKVFRRSYIRTQLLCQLRQGKKYRIEFYIKSKHDILDSIGIYFTPYDFLFEKQILRRIIPGVYIADAVQRPERKDTNWQKVSIDYTASGDELYLTLGNFSKNDLCGPTNVPLENSFFVFFDDISLTPEDPDEKICDGWQITKEDIYDFDARHQFLDVYIKSHIRNMPDPPKMSRTIFYRIDTLTVPDVFFDVNQSSLNKKSFHLLDSLSASLQRDQIDSLIVEGYTDNTGSVASNEKLSNDRASSVATYLSQKLSVKKERVIARGYGDERPVADNGTIRGRQLNRRVELFIYIRQ
jgi:outer membrane protein OmpA-like peptidoglycan-associated protein